MSSDSKLTVPLPSYSEGRLKGLPAHRPVMRRTSHTARRHVGHASRYSAVALASFMVVAQLSTFAHLLLVRHVVCPEHGELIHPDEQGGRAGAAAPSHAVAKATLPGVSSIQAAAERPATHGHDHCLLASHRRERATLPVCRVSAVISGPKNVGIRHVEDAPRPATVAIFRLAPKNSPPA